MSNFLTKRYLEFAVKWCEIFYMAFSLESSFFATVQIFCPLCNPDKICPINRCFLNRVVFRYYHFTVKLLSLQLLFCHDFFFLFYHVNFHRYNKNNLSTCKNTFFPVLVIYARERHTECCRTDIILNNICLRTRRWYWLSIYLFSLSSLNC